MRLILNAAFNVFANVGITKYLQRLAAALQDRCELTILTPEPAVFSAQARFVRTPVWTARSIGRLPWAMAGVRQHLQPRTSTVLVCPTPDTPAWPPMPTISFVHDLTPIVVSRQHRFRDKALFLASLYTLRWADAIFTVSHNTARDLINWSPALERRVSVCYNGPGIVPSEHRTGFAEQYRPYLLYVGGFSPHKNLSRLIKTFASLRERPELALVLVGGALDPNINEVMELAHRLGVANRLHILSSLVDDAVSELYSRAELLVYPSLYEGFGLPVLEALVHGTPVCCSNTSSLPEVAGPLAVYFNPTQDHEISAAVRFGLAHRGALADRIASEARSLSSFSWGTAADRVLSTASRLVGTRESVSGPDLARPAG